MIVEEILDVLVRVDIAPFGSLLVTAGIPAFILIMIAFWHEKKSSRPEGMDVPDWNRSLDCDKPLQTRTLD